MKRLLYITNIKVPYRVRFFNSLAKHCELTVLYERKESRNRNSAWADSEKEQYHTIYLDGMPIGNEFSFSLKLLKVIWKNYDCIVLGCFNSPIQITASVIMRILHKPFCFAFDGELFMDKTGLKTKLKKLFLSGAKTYLTAGEMSAESLCNYVNGRKVVPFYFSSLSEEELNRHREAASHIQRGDTVLIVGQYFDYKGMDVAFQAAQMDSSIHYKFVGMGKRTDDFIREHTSDGAANVEIIPFLSKADLEEEYKNAALLVLPSRQECWGLVINEAASFGTPIVSTWGSGAAVEFLSEKYPQFLAKPGDPHDLCHCIRLLKEYADIKTYSEYLLEKSKQYSIEKSVLVYLQTLYENNEYK